jgi:hypothetical protein
VGREPTMAGARAGAGAGWARNRTDGPWNAGPGIKMAR